YDNLTGYGLVDAYTAIYGPPAPVLRNYFDGFESGALGPAWEHETQGDAAIQVTTANGPATGTSHLLLHSLDALPASPSLPPASPCLPIRGSNSSSSATPSRRREGSRSTIFKSWVTPPPR